jgi:sulfite dehydrogenase (cytochrome) subunit B
VKLRRADVGAAVTAPFLIAFGLIVTCAIPWAAAGEVTQLKDGPGRDLTVGRCIICHSVEYIPSNAPAMNRAAWQKTIQKMKDRFGAPITDEEAKQILDYLDANYSGKSS